MALFAGVLGLLPTLPGVFEGGSVIREESVMVVSSALRGSSFCFSSFCVESVGQLLRAG